MRVIIESTCSSDDKPDPYRGLRAEVSVDGDDLDIWGVKDLLRQALLGYGFFPNSVDELFDEDREDS